MMAGPLPLLPWPHVIPWVDSGISSMFEHLLCSEHCFWLQPSWDSQSRGADR